MIVVAGACQSGHNGDMHTVDRRLCASRGDTLDFGLLRYCLLEFQAESNLETYPMLAEAPCWRFSREGLKLTLRKGHSSVCSRYQPARLEIYVAALATFLKPI